MKCTTQVSGSGKKLVGLSLVAYLAVLLFLPSVAPVTLAAPQAPTPKISEPTCSYPGDVPLTLMPEVRANIIYAGSFQDLAVTFHYVALNGSQSYTPQYRSNDTLNRIAPMFLVNNNGSNSLYTTIPLPDFQNYTQLFGYVQAVDPAGDISYSNDNQYPLPTCYYYSPAPKATFDLGMTVLDVNPRYLNLTMYITGTAMNSETFRPVFLRDYFSFFTLNLNQSESSGLWLYQGHGTESFYSYGIARLFPADSYNYSIYLEPTEALNVSAWTLNSVKLTPNQAVSNVINYTLNPTLAQSTDNDAWTLTSSATFTPTNSSHPASLAITLHVVRKSSEVLYPVLVPLLALYALLSISLVAARPGDLANRLLVYISILIFFPEFLNYIGTLVAAPVTTGSNMVDLLILALVPCTVILAGCSFMRWIPWIGGRANAADVVDLVGIALAAVTLWFYAQFGIPAYSATAPNHTRIIGYTLLNLSWFGLALLAIFAAGMVIPVARLILRREGAAGYFLRRRLRQNAVSQRHDKP